MFKKLNYLQNNYNIIGSVQNITDDKLDDIEKIFLNEINKIFLSFIKYFL